ncbi:MAG TPA: DUF2306 domain-containing protein [Rhizomicrobium sp.]|nr:DUF2306 domain-containing protein [Rhizomicrobium sp.]
MTVIAEPVGSPGRFKWPRPKYLLFALIALMYLYVLWTNESFLFNSKDPEWPHIAPFRWFLLPHGMAAAFALFLGPLQFSERLRRRFATVHHVMGYLYITGVYLGAPMGIYIQHFEERLGAPRSFTLAAAADAVVWIFATTMALVFIRQGRIQQHRQWMTRSFACALIFLEVRLILTLFNLPVAMAETVVWCCVVAAFPIADLILQLQERSRTGRQPRVANHFVA